MREQKWGFAAEMDLLGIRKRCQTELTLEHPKMLVSKHPRQGKTCTAGKSILLAVGQEGDRPL